VNETGIPGSRDLYWSGGYNIRDLGGLPAADGGSTAWGTLVRSASLHRLTQSGWQALAGYGIRTIIDLRNQDERQQDPSCEPPAGVSLVNVPIDELAGREWYQSVWHLDGTPRIFPCYLTDHPEAAAAVVKTIAAAGPGGVLFHCAGGRDRTGLVTLLLLALAHVAPEAIAADYTLSYERQRAAWAALGMSSLLAQVQADQVEQMYADSGSTAAGIIKEILTTLNIPAILINAGVTTAELAAVTARLRGVHD
jgi:protein tyrosine/serine phosphatase